MVSEKDILRAIEEDFDDMASALQTNDCESLIPLFRDFTTELEKTVKLLYACDNIRA